jgi:hypothetical protein
MKNTGAKTTAKPVTARQMAVACGAEPGFLATQGVKAAEIARQKITQNKMVAALPAYQSVAANRRQDPTAPFGKEKRRERQQCGPSFKTRQHPPTPANTRQHPPPHATDIEAGASRTQRQTEEKTSEYPGVRLSRGA